VAAKLAIAEYPEAEVVRMMIDSEHPDGNRFAADVQAWLGKPIKEIRSPNARTHWEVIERDRYINGPTGARCTMILKRRVRADYQRPDDLHVFGFDYAEEDRVADFRENHPDLNFIAPLIDAGLSKEDCLGILQRAGIRPHAMYELGYPNANCVGCVKGGMGYWNKIRVDFPDVFARMAKNERDIGATCIKRKDGTRVWLDELDPNAGRDEPPLVAECTILCHLALDKVGL
jgi:hypothetical protein